MHSSQFPLRLNSVIMKPGPPSSISLFSQKVKRKSELKKNEPLVSIDSGIKKNILRALKKIRKKETFCLKKDEIWSNLHAKMGLSCMAMSNGAAKQLTP